MKKAILVVSFGTTYIDARKKTIDVIEEKVRKEFPAYEVRRAYTAHMIIKRLKNRDNSHIDTPEEALRRLMDEGFEEVIVQPLHIIPGSEYHYIQSVVAHFKHEKAFKKISLGRPALYFKGGDGIPDDYVIFVDAMKEHINKRQAFVLMGHGSVHYSNACYACLQQVLHDEGYLNVYIGNVEGYPKIDIIMDRLREKGIKEVILKPLMLVSGDHANNDMVGDNKDSWQSQLAQRGISSQVDMRSLGEIGTFQEIYIQHIKDAISGDYKEVEISKKVQMSVT